MRNCESKISRAYLQSFGDQTQDIVHPILFHGGNVLRVDAVSNVVIVAQNVLLRVGGLRVSPIDGR